MKALWTQEETDRLLTMIGEGKSNKQIAAALGRTERAVAHKRAAILNAGKAPEPDAVEDETGEGETELEREIKHHITMIDIMTEELIQSRKLIEGDLAAMMERTNELGKDITALIDDHRASMTEIGMLHDKLNTVAEYLSKGRLYRLFHSFKSFWEARL